MCAPVARTHTHYNIYAYAHHIYIKMRLRAKYIYMCVPPGHTYLCVYPWRPHIHYNINIYVNQTHIYMCVSEPVGHTYVCVCACPARTLYMCVLTLHLYMCVCARVLGHGDQCVCFLSVCFAPRLLSRKPGLVAAAPASKTARWPAGRPAAI